MQARWRCALYQSMCDRTKDGSMTAHFLRYLVVANNLTSKLTESDVVEIISGHYPAYVQHTILSVGIRAIRDALNLLNKLESLESDGGRRSNPGSSTQNRANPSYSHTKLSQDRSYVARPGFQNMRNMRYQGSRNYYRDGHYSQGNSRLERDNLSSGSGRQGCSKKDRTF